MGDRSHPFAGIPGTVLPGFVDLQLNGGFGHDFTSEPASIWEVGALLPRLGVTAFLPTVVTAPPEAALAALETVAGGPPPGWVGAAPLGVHLEGPMLSPAARGTHPARFLRPPDPGLVDAVIAAGPPLMVTLAPELPGAEQAVRRLAEAGTVVSLGHSAAGAALAAEAVEWGARHVTHLFNAMSGLAHRSPGLAATALLDDRLTVGLIADGVHLAPEMLRIALEMKGPDRIALVTDSISAMGLGGGAHHIGSVPVTVEGVTVRNADGALAGSAATMAHVLRSMLAATGCSLDEAAAMTSATPARIAGHRSHPGDLVLLDADLEVAATAVEGRVVHARSEP